MWPGDQGRAGTSLKEKTIKLGARKAAQIHVGGALRTKVHNVEIVAVTRKFRHKNRKEERIHSASSKDGRWRS